MFLIIFRRFLNFGLKIDHTSSLAEIDFLVYQSFADTGTKNPNIYIWVPKMGFSKMYIFGAPIESEGPCMVSSYS